MVHLTILVNIHTAVLLLLSKRLSQGYKGINALDKACMKHDVAYAEHSDTSSRNYYDDILSAQAAEIALDQVNLPTKNKMPKL